MVKRLTERKAHKIMSRREYYEKGKPKPEVVKARRVIRKRKRATNRK